MSPVFIESPVSLGSTSVSSGPPSLAAWRLCRAAHTGADEALASLAAWTCFEYQRADAMAARAARLNQAWSPLALLMSLLPERGRSQRGRPTMDTGVASGSERPSA